MSQGLFVAAGGIKACQSKIDVVADNIANINTVGFKSSQVTFENVFSRTLSSGSSPSANLGGSNPMQIGLGVTISDISRNFTGGTIQSTGRSSDLNIGGNGFFTVQNSDGSTYLTRAGNFTLNSDGGLTTAKGLRVLGTAELNGIESSVPVKIPQSLCIQKTPIDTDQSNVITNVISDANVRITSGTFSVGVSGYPVAGDLLTTGGSESTAITAGTFTINGVDGGTTPISVTFTSTDTFTTAMGKIQTAIQTETGGTGAATYNATTGVISLSSGVGTDTLTFSGTSNFATLAGFGGSAGSYTSDAIAVTSKTVTITTGDSIDDVMTDLTNQLGGSASASVDSEGRITIIPPSGRTLDYDGLLTDTSNFLSVANFTTGGVSNELKDASRATISVGDETANTTMLSSWSVGKSGEIEATYENGDKLTVITDPDDETKRVLRLTTSGINVIDPTVIANAVQASELQLQMANVVNPKGLMSEGGNMFTVGPNSGSVEYSIGSANGIGIVQSGGLESSNVDLTTEFADMMLAQRGIDANSRTFSAQNQIMQTIVNLGRG
jgi:flagellar hook protein FlgE